MTPSARVSASIEILETILSGEAAEKVLTRWGRANRYAGSGDRAAIRDHVFDALRCKRSFGYLGGGETGRNLMIGWARNSGIDCNSLFSKDKYASGALSPAEKSLYNLSNAERGVQLDYPDWLLAALDNDLGTDADRVLSSLQARAPVYLRVNLAKAERQHVQAILKETEIVTRAVPDSETALQVIENPRRVSKSRAYVAGLVEIQDLSSQAVVDHLPLKKGDTVLDYCAGGGGKSLAMAARAEIDVTAHDIDPPRMREIPIRAKRADVTIKLADTSDLEGRQFDLVLCDAPCSGSGSWRRSPDTKWKLTPERLTQLIEIQIEILTKASAFVSGNGTLAYVTCSIIAKENDRQVEKFLAVNRDWTLINDRRWLPLSAGDGFYVALLTREK